jgi:hypothetical protein
MIFYDRNMQMNDHKRLGMVVNGKKRLKKVERWLMFTMNSTKRWENHVHITARKINCSKQFF